MKVFLLLGLAGIEDIRFSLLKRASSVRHSKGLRCSLSWPYSPWLLPVTCLFLTKEICSLMPGLILFLWVSQRHGHSDWHIVGASMSQFSWRNERIFLKYLKRTSHNLSSSPLILVIISCKKENFSYKLLKKNFIFQLEFISRGKEILMK